MSADTTLLLAARQCFAMDLMGINKDEMTHPHRHILVHAVASTPDAAETSSQTHKCTFIDFEKCVYSSKPKNVTQLCQVRVVSPSFHEIPL